MASGAASIALRDKGISRASNDFVGVDRSRRASATQVAAAASGGAAFLRVPPFPGARVRSLSAGPAAVSDPAELADTLRRLRVGGSFWGQQPDLPPHAVLIRCEGALESSKQLLSGRTAVLWQSVPGPAERGAGLFQIAGECDPWHMLSGAAALVAEPQDEVRLVAALLGVDRYLYDRQTGLLTADATDAAELLRATVSGSYENPFTGEPMDALGAAALCGFWRRLIDANRGLAGGLGIAFWKQDHVAPLLWGGGKPFQFLRDLKGVPSGSPVAAWCAKTRPELLAELNRRKISLVEVEDGFLRSQGLGADCVPPLSITVDRLGAHFDPSRPSELEVLLQEHEFDHRILARAAELRRLVVSAGLAKYEQGSSVLERRCAERRHVLVPGQVEDDRAVLAGGCGLVSNLELVKRVREQAPDAYIIYKPHPDVLAGHRRGMIAERTCLQFADEIIGDVSIVSLIDLVDEVHVNSSLAGFEALLRGKRVATYGVPFYAGWGLTWDLGPVPARRTARRTLDELVAATLLLYPRYLDPVTGLPCPAEVVVDRLSAGMTSDAGLLVGMRRLQGRVMRRLRSLVQ